MALEELTLEGLGDLDGGRVAAAFEQALKRCRLDCADRPGAAETRKINLVLTMAPNMSEQGDLHSVQIDVQVSETLPKRKSRSCQMAVDHKGVYYNDLSPDNPNQGTLDSAGEFLPGQGPQPTTPPEAEGKKNVS